MSVHDCASSMVVVAVDVGKNTVACSVTDDKRHRLLEPVDFAMTRAGLRSTLTKIRTVVPSEASVKVGIEAAGHYHQPLMAPSSWPTGWQLLELNPAHVTEQRWVQGRRRIKTDAIDLEAITELVLAGQGSPVTGRAVVLGESAAWVRHRSRRVEARTALKNQLLGQLDRAFPGLTMALPDVLATKVGRLVVEHFSDPARLAALGESRLVRFAATRGLAVRRPVAARLVAAAPDALPTPDATVAREMVANDLQMLLVMDRHVAAAEEHLGALLPATPFAVLTTVPGWGTVRASGYGAAIGDPGRWPGPAQIYRASGFSPMQYESAGKRRDGRISREGSVILRRALIDLGIGLWLDEPAAKAYAAGLRARGKRAVSSPALWPTARTGSPTHWCANKVPTTAPAGRRRSEPHRILHNHRRSGAGWTVTKDRIRRRFDYGGPRGLRRAWFGARPFAPCAARTKPNDPLEVAYVSVSAPPSSPPLTAPDIAPDIARARPCWSGSGTLALLAPLWRRERRPRMAGVAPS